MVITTKEMYSEVYGVIKALGDKYIKKLHYFIYFYRINLIETSPFFIPISKQIAENFLEQIIDTRTKDC